MSSPSFDVDGRPDVLLGLLVFRTDLPYQELVRYGTAVREAAARVTKQVAGREPWRGLKRPPRCRV